jgi:hypothetical protein
MMVGRSVLAAGIVRIMEASTYQLLDTVFATTAIDDHTAARAHEAGSDRLVVSLDPDAIHA